MGPSNSPISASIESARFACCPCRISKDQLIDVRTGARRRAQQSALSAFSVLEGASDRGGPVWGSDGDETLCDRSEVGLVEQR